LSSATKPDTPITREEITQGGCGTLDDPFHLIDWPAATTSVAHIPDVSSHSQSTCSNNEQSQTSKARAAIFSTEPAELPDTSPWCSAKTVLRTIPQERATTRETAFPSAQQLKSQEGACRLHSPIPPSINSGELPTFVLLIHFPHFNTIESENELNSKSLIPDKISKITGKSNPEAAPQIRQTKAIHTQNFPPTSVRLNFGGYTIPELQNISKVTRKRATHL
ncbi:hypothetical protein MMC29_007355, partial [Sticta canariensis]|nr:hypothetical protein [Sticta canariensis]